MDRGTQATCSVVEQFAPNTAVSTSSLFQAAVSSEQHHRAMVAWKRLGARQIFRYTPVASLRGQLDGHRGVRIDADAGRRAPALDRVFFEQKRQTYDRARARE